MKASKTKFGNASSSIPYLCRCFLSFILSFFSSSFKEQSVMPTELNITDSISWQKSRRRLGLYARLLGVLVLGVLVLFCYSLISACYYGSNDVVVTCTVLFTLIMGTAVFFTSLRMIFRRDIFDSKWWELARAIMYLTASSAYLCYWVVLAVVMLFISNQLHGTETSMGFWEAVQSLHSDRKGLVYFDISIYCALLPAAAVRVSHYRPSHFVSCH